MKSQNRVCIQRQQPRKAHVERSRLPRRLRQYQVSIPPTLALGRDRSLAVAHGTVIRHPVDGFSPVQWESLQTLVTDGGEVSPADIADEHSRHVESVRRALRGIEDLVVREYAKVSLRSNYVAELVHDAVQEAEEAVKRAAETGAKAIRVAEQGMEETMSVFIAWAARAGRVRA